MYTLSEVERFYVLFLLFLEERRIVLNRFQIHHNGNSFCSSCFYLQKMILLKSKFDSTLFFSVPTWNLNIAIFSHQDTESTSYHSVSVSYQTLGNYLYFWILGYYRYRSMSLEKSFLPRENLSSNFFARSQHVTPSFVLFQFFLFLFLFFFWVTEDYYKFIGGVKSL